ncbi:nuclease-related domain-containing protein [Neobacillus sp. LXY-4]|uniref:nuclease-related domain-containing protein n=1 Tax=Neobacillus sp. LXY-4 TaxID=3379826 RepID=UPI003EE07012
MNAKPRLIPLIVEEIDAVLSRIPLFHPKRAQLEEERRNYMAGYNGEKQIDHYLDSYINGNYLYFADLRLIFENHAFQMDTLIVTPFFLVIIESKNIAGILTFEKDSTQVIREYNGKLQGFKNPIVQVKRQKKLLTAWLKKHKFPPIPIVDLVGVADRRTIIKTSSDNRQIFQKLIYADVLEEKIKTYEDGYTKKQLSARQITKLHKLLLEEHTPALPSILKFHSIDVSELIKGIQCPICKQFSLVRQVKNWFCVKCKIYSKNAHKKAIVDYFLLISPSVSNKNLREFILVNSRHIVKKLLQSLNLPTSGSNKNRQYHRPKDVQHWIQRQRS